MKHFFTLLFVLLMIVPKHINAQPEFDDDVQDTPVDGGVGLLLAAGATYGWKKLKEKKRKE